MKRFRSVGVVVLAVALSGCSGTALDGGTSTTTSRREPTGELVIPRVGECRGLITREIIRAASDSRRPLSCDQPHGSETVFVEDLPPEVAARPHRYVSELTNDAPELRTILDRCDEEYERYVGVSRIGPDSVRVSNLARAFYVPTGEEWAQGARWLRCDAVTEPLNGQVSRETMESLRGILDREFLPPQWRACYRDVTPPPALRFDFFTSCDHPHAGEALVRFQVSDPAIDAAAADPRALEELSRTAFNEACTDRVASLVGLPTSDLLARRDVTVGIVVPQLSRWASDPKARWVQCLAFTPRLTVGTLEALGSAPLPRP